jgi:hypothetical protein
MIEDLTSCSWDKTHFAFIKYIFSVHGKSFATSSLAVSKNSAIIALHNILNHRASHYTKDFFLAYIGLEDMIKGKAQV